MPQIMQPALQARPGGRFMDGMRHGIDLPPVIVPIFKLGWGSSQRWFAKGNPKTWHTKVYRTCHYQQLPPFPEKYQFSVRYLARTFVGRKISDGGGRGTPGCRREWLGVLRLKSLAMLWMEGFWISDKFRIGQL